MLVAQVIAVVAMGIAISYTFYVTVKKEEVKDNIIAMNAMAIYQKGTPREMVWRKRIVNYVRQNRNYVDMDDIVWREDLRKEGLL